MKIANEVKVWDPLVRIFHWSLVASFITAYLSEHDWFAMHIWSGFTVAGLVAFRLLWGFIGTEHARFRDFVFSPVTVLNYLKDFVARHPQRYIGHSPAGGAMVVALLISLTALTLSGMQLYAVAEHSGPLVSLQASIINFLGSQADSKYYWIDVHAFFVNLTLTLVFLHVSSVVLSSLAHHENLPRAMVTGKKRKEINDAPCASGTWRAD